MVYHRSCKLAIITLASMSAENVVQRAPILTRTKSGPIDWNVCIFCNNKTHKNVKTLKKIESNEIISRILDASNHYSDSNMKSKEPTDDQFLHGIAKIIRKILESGIFYRTLPNTSGCIFQSFISFYA